MKHPKPIDRPVLDYSGSQPKPVGGQSSEGVASLVAGCVNALGLALLFTRKLPPQVGMMVAMAAFFVALWGLGFGLYAIWKDRHESFAIIGLTTNTLALVITITLGAGACCMGRGFPIGAPG